MKKIAFIVNHGIIEPFGILYLGGMLKRHGYAYEIVFLTNNYLREIKACKPDIVAYNVVIGTQEKFLEANRKIKRHFPGVFSVFGGHYPTLVQDMICEEGVDAICISEGDHAFLDLVKALCRGEDYSGIRNFHFKLNGNIVRNPMRPLVADLDALPFPDRDVLYAKNSVFKKVMYRRFLTKRGCPYSCTYCYNEKLRAMSKGLGPHFRMQSVDRVIAEIEHVIKRYPSPTIYFLDDTFTVNNSKWMNEFCEKYKKKVNIPFGCQIRIGTFDYATLERLKDAGMYQVLIGVETATESMRKEVLNRNYSNEQVKDACSMLKDLKITYRTLNMLGLPKGGLEEALKTMRFNQELKADYSSATIFQPYPGSAISKFTKKHGYLPDDFDLTDSSPTWFSTTKLSFGTPEEGRQIVTLQRIFSICVKFPFIGRFAPALIKIPDNPLLVLIGNLWKGLCFVRIHKKGIALGRIFSHMKFFFKSKEFI